MTATIARIAIDNRIPTIDSVDIVWVPKVGGVLQCILQPVYAVSRMVGVLTRSTEFPVKDWR